jgi:hypothetical protein
MSKSLRLSEKWFRRGLWLVALVFASFLIGLGSTVVGDLPQVERVLSSTTSSTSPRPSRCAGTIKASRPPSSRPRALDQIRLQLHAAQQASANARDTFGNWIATRRATAQPDQDTELIARTKALDVLQAEGRRSPAPGRTRRSKKCSTRARPSSAPARIARASWNAPREKLACRVPPRRAARVRLPAGLLTLPLLVIAGWLFAKKRKSTYWPFVWGFIFFALFAFFVELVPYLPSYGGYVRYVVGIVLTVLVGRYAIVALNRYLARQKLAEQQPDQVRREELSYDVALRGSARACAPAASGRWT